MGSTGFLSFNKRPPQLHVCGEDDEFDPATLRFFRDEGFDVTFHSLAQGRPVFQHAVLGIADDLELGEHYAIVAYGAAATVCMQLAQKPMPRLCALVVYYPDALPSPNFKYPTQLPLVLHLAGAQSLGGATVKTFWYRGTEAGFAEMDLAEYEPIAAGLAWSRTLGTVRKGFNINVDLEAVWEEHLQCKRPLPLLAVFQTLGFLSRRTAQLERIRIGRNLRHGCSGAIAFVDILFLPGGWADDYSITCMQTSTRPKTRPKPCLP